MTELLHNPKIKPEHLARKAIVYLRQSSDKQVRQNKESQLLQYAMAERVRALGWQEVEIINNDLGSSAGLAAAQREGFERVLSSVALGEVGIVGSREVSRQSRTDKDWCRLLEVCQIFGTLIADEQQVYDLNNLDDQLVLGIKGTLSLLSSRTRRSGSRAAALLRLAAVTVGRTDTALGAFYRRLSARIGKAKAVTATARKIAVLFYNAVRHGMDYVDPGASFYETRYRARVIDNLHRRAKVFGFALQPIAPTPGIAVS